MIDAQIIDFALEKARKQLNDIYKLPHTSWDDEDYAALLKYSRIVDQHIERVMLSGNYPDMPVIAGARRDGACKNLSSL